MEKFCHAFNLLLTRIKGYCSLHKEKGQPYGLCIANPKRSSIGVPTKEIHAELEKKGRDYFTRLNAVGFYFRYWTPPLLPVVNETQTDLPVSADDYQLTFKLPQFDEQWEHTTVARGLIYCPADQEQQCVWNEWFEIQEEAIRLTPLLHHSLKECKTCGIIRIKLRQLGMPAFENFIYEYAKTDCNFPLMNKAEQEKWDRRQIDWKIRYRLVANLFSNRMTLRMMYSTAHAKAASSRNPIVKSLLWDFLSSIDKQLISDTDLSDDEKKRQISELRHPKDRKPKKGKYVAKRPVVCISDMECATLLYSLIKALNSAISKSKVTAEAILFILIAQHAAFSDISLNVEDIRSIKVSDIDQDALTILAKDQEIHITEGLKDVLMAWIETNQKRLFQKLTYDNLEDILEKHSQKLFGFEGKLHPRDFLEKVHVIPYARISVDLRKQLSNQEKLAAHSPYRINANEIKKEIKASIRKKQISSNGELIPLS